VLTPLPSLPPWSPTQAKSALLASTCAEQAFDVLTSTARQQGAQLIEKGLAIRGLSRELFSQLESENEDVMRSLDGSFNYNLVCVWLRFLPSRCRADSHGGAQM